MESLQELRKKLDEVDNQIVKLFAERMEICEKVGEYKIRMGKPVLDSQREAEKLADVASMVEGEFLKQGVQELYKQLMRMSRELQYQKFIEVEQNENE